MKKLTLLTTLILTVMFSSTSFAAEERDFMGFYWGMDCGSAASRFKGSGTGLIFKSDTQFKVKFMKEDVLLKLGCLGSNLFKDGHLACINIMVNGTPSNQRLQTMCRSLISLYDRKYGAHERSVPSRAADFIHYTWKTNNTEVDVTCFTSVGEGFWSL